MATTELIIIYGIPMSLTMFLFIGFVLTLIATVVLGYYCKDYSIVLVALCPLVWALWPIILAIVTMGFVAGLAIAIYEITIYSKIWK